MPGMTTWRMYAATDCLSFFGKISVDGISHLRIEPRPRALEPREPELRLGQRAHTRHTPVALRAIAAVARFARHVLGAADERSERVPRERHHLALHEGRDLLCRAPIAVRRNRIVFRVDHRRQRRLAREGDEDRTRPRTPAWPRAQAPDAGAGSRARRAPMRSGRTRRRAPRVSSPNSSVARS